MLTIKMAVDADAPVIALLVGQSFRKQAEILGLSQEKYPNYVAFETDACVRSRMASGVYIALGCMGEELVGTVSCLVRTDRPSEITRLAVLPEFRGKNYGRELMTYAENYLLAEGAIAAELSIVAQFTRLESYYQELGYSARELRRIRSLPFDLLYMQKAFAAERGSGKSR